MSTRETFNFIYLCVDMKRVWATRHIKQKVEWLNSNCLVMLNVLFCYDRPINWFDEVINGLKIYISLCLIWFITNNNNHNTVFHFTFISHRKMVKIFDFHKHALIFYFPISYNPKRKDREE